MPRATLATAISHVRAATDLLAVAEAHGMDWRDPPPELAELGAAAAQLQVRARNLRRPPPIPPRFVAESDGLHARSLAAARAKGGKSRKCQQEKD